MDGVVYRRFRTCFLQDGYSEEYASRAFSRLVFVGFSE